MFLQEFAKKGDRNYDASQKRPNKRKIKSVGKMFQYKPVALTTSPTAKNDTLKRGP